MNAGDATVPSRPSVSVSLIRHWRRQDLLLASALGIGLGLGVAGSVSFALMPAGWPPAAQGIVETLVLVAAAGVAIAVVRRDSVVGGGQPSRTRALLQSALAVTTVWAVVNFVHLVRLSPHGGWDAWMTWNLRARFLHRGYESWTDAFTPMLAWAHPDYPALLPMLVARGWWHLGSEAVVVPAALGGLFALVTLGALYGGIARLRGARQACLAGLVLLSVPFFLQHAAAQYADVPLGFFVLAALVLVTLDAQRQPPGGVLMALAGVAAGLAAWTKNEGTVFLLALVVARVLLAEGWDWARCGRPIAIFALGALPFVALLAYFKLQVAPPNEVVAMQASRPRELWYYSSGSAADQVRELAARALSIDRHLVVARIAKAKILAFGWNGLYGTAGVLFTYLICQGVRMGGGDYRPVLTAGLALILTLGGYWIALVTAPGDMPRLVNSSFDRLLLQLWPGAVFVYFVTVARPLPRDGDESHGT